MNENPDTRRKTEELSWLENLQRNSWEPEVIISGIILAFLFIFPTKIYEFCAYLNQEHGIGYFFSLLLLFYFTSIISVFKIFFVVHLALRFFWTGLLGLSYAFPKGVINENLFKAAQNYNYQKPDEMVLRMERICSMTFAYPISFVITFLIITLYLGVLVGIYLLLDLSYLTIYLLFMGSLLLIILMQWTKKKTRIKTWYVQTIINSIAATYQSNLGKWFAIFYSFFIFILAIPIISADTKDFTLFNNERGLNSFEQEWPAKNLYFADHHDSEKRYPRVFLPSEETDDDLLKIGIARYEGDRRILEDLKTHFQSTIDSLNWHSLNETADLHRVFLNDSLISLKNWSKFRLPQTGQRTYQNVINIIDLKPGIHQIRVEKLILDYSFTTNEPRLRYAENWANFEFIKK